MGRICMPEKVVSVVKLTVEENSRDQRSLGRSRLRWEDRVRAEKGQIRPDVSRRIATAAKR